MYPVIVIAVLGATQAAVINIPEKNNEQTEDNNISLINTRWLIPLIEKYGFKKPAYDDDFKDFARTLGVNDPGVLAEVRAVYDQPTLFVFIAPLGSLFTVYSQDGFNNDSLTLATKILLYNMLNYSADFGEEESEDQFKSPILEKLPTLLPDNSESPGRGFLSDILNAQNKLGIMNPKAVAVFFIRHPEPSRCLDCFSASTSDISEKNNEPNDDGNISLIHPYWVLQMIFKYGYTKPAYDDDFKEFARTLEASDPDLFSEVRSIYDQPTLFVFVGQSGVLFSMYSQEGFNNDISIETKDLFHTFIAASAFRYIYGLADEEFSDDYKSAILERLPVSNCSETPERDLLSHVQDAQNKLGITNPKNVVFLFIDEDKKNV